MFPQDPSIRPPPREVLPEQVLSAEMTVPVQLQRVALDETPMPIADVDMRLLEEDLVPHRIEETPDMMRLNQENFVVSANCLERGVNVTFNVRGMVELDSFLGIRDF